MTDVITKVAIGGVEYPFAGGGSEGQEVVYLTQAEYDVLPASKLTDGKIYKVKTTGVPGGVLTAGAGIDITSNTISADMSTAVYDNTTSGATATNMQDAMDEVFQSVSNGKELIADAITDKGVSTSATDSFQTMAANISSLEIATQQQIQTYNLARGKDILIDTISYDSTRTQTVASYFQIEDKTFLIAGVASQNGSSNESTYTGKIYTFNYDGTYTFKSASEIMYLGGIYLINGFYHIFYYYYRGNSGNTYYWKYRINATTYEITESNIEIGTGYSEVLAPYEQYRYTSTYTMPYTIQTNASRNSSSINITVPIS